MAKASKDHIIQSLKARLADFEATVEKSEVGQVIEVGDGVARVAHLTQVASQEMVVIETEEGEVSGVALNLESDVTGVMILGNIRYIREGDKVRRTNRILEVPVGNELIGRVVNPLGQILDGHGDIKAAAHYPAEKVAPAVITR